MAQNNWRWCQKCQGLFFAGTLSLGVCPAGEGHDPTGSEDYTLNLGAAGSGQQQSWRWCIKCQGLFYAGNTTTGTCPAGGGHNYSGNLDYSLDLYNPDLGKIVDWQQQNWRWCNRCQGLFFAGNFTTGACPNGGGHNYSGSADYLLNFQLELIPVDPPFIPDPPPVYRPVPGEEHPEQN